MPSPLELADWLTFRPHKHRPNLTPKSEPLRRTSGTPKTPKEPTPQARSVSSQVKFELEIERLTETKSDAPKPPAGKTEDADGRADEAAAHIREAITERDLHFRADSPPAIHPASLPDPLPLGRAAHVASSATTSSQVAPLLPSPNLTERRRRKSADDSENDETMRSSGSESDDEDSSTESDDGDDGDEGEELVNPLNFLRSIQSGTGADMAEASGPMNEDEN